jgi:phosphoserine phosphatase
MLDNGIGRSWLCATHRETYRERCVGSVLGGCTRAYDPQMQELGSYPVVAFDLDGTLLRGTSVSLLLAQWLGQAEEIAELERAFHAHEISNSVVADTSAGWLAGQHITDIHAVLARGAWIDGLSDTLRALAAAGTKLLLGTVTWKFAAQMLQERYGFAAVSGTEMQVRDGVLSGAVTRYFDEHDKVRFVEEWCTCNSYSMRQVAAIGDSRSDVPLFERVGMSIALNATPDARSAATHVLDTDNLRDVLTVLNQSEQSPPLANDDRHIGRL